MIHFLYVPVSFISISSETLILLQYSIYVLFTFIILHCIICKISNNGPNHLFGTNVYRTLEFC